MVTITAVITNPPSLINTQILLDAYGNQSNRMCCVTLIERVQGYENRKKPDFPRKLENIDYNKI